MKTRERANFPEINMLTKQMLTATMVINTRTGRDENNRRSCTARGVYSRGAKSGTRILRLNLRAGASGPLANSYFLKDIVGEHQKSVLTLVSEARFHVS